MEINIRRGLKIGDGLVIQKEISAGESWGIYRTFTGRLILIADRLLMMRWVEAGLLSADIFSCFGSGEETVYYAESLTGDRLEYLKAAAVPSDISDVFSFTAAFTESRKIIRDSINWGDSIFFEQYSRLLPTYEETDSISDDVVLGRWMTGGVAVSAQKIGDIEALVSWGDAEEIKKAVEASGFEAEAVPAETEPVKQGGDVLPQEPFSLPGRKELTDFFNEHVIDILRKPEEYARMGIEFPGAVLMYGPPGSGKTYAAEQVAKYLSWPCFSVDSGSIGSKYIHETSQKIAELFSEAMAQAPSMLIIDEMESFLSRRANSGSNLHHTEEVGEFLRILQKAKEKHVLVIGMTNMIDDIDAAVKRKGRFDHLLYVGMPSAEELSNLMKNLMEKLPIAKDVNVDKLAENLEGCSMAEAAFLLKEAGRLAVRGGKEEIDQETLEEAEKSLGKKEETKRTIGF